MSRLFRRIVVASFLSLLSVHAFSEAPVVDDSENFALLEEQQVAPSAPVAREEANSTFDSDEPALARETASSNTSGDNAELLNRVQGLQQDIQELRGQLEVQTHDIAQLKEQQLAFYKDLDDRMRNVPTKASAALNEPKPISNSGEQPSVAKNIPPTASVTTPDSAAIKPLAITPTISSARTNPAEEQISYLAAYEQVKNKHFDDAIEAMQAFVTKYPEGGYTANAHYWLGELFMVKKNYQEAMLHFDVVLKKFPSSSKCGASLLKMAYALADTGKLSEAKERLHEVIKNYPDTPTAELATAKLGTLG